MELMHKTGEESGAAGCGAGGDEPQADGGARRIPAAIPARMNESLDQKLGESQEKVRGGVRGAVGVVEELNTEQQTELRNGFHKLGDEAVG